MRASRRQGSHRFSNSLTWRARSPTICRAMVTRVILLAATFAAAVGLGGNATAQQPEADVFVAQAVLAYADKRYDDALALLQDALKLDPDHVEALYYTGLVRLAQRRPDLALEPLERAL